MDDMTAGNQVEAEGGQLDAVVPVYANNVKFELTVWDLRILFGQLLPMSEGIGQVDWHTDVTIPWAQAKLMNLYLEINIALYERENGKITIPAGVLPPLMSSPPEGVDTSNPDAIKAFKMVQALVEEFRDRELSK